MATVTQTLSTVGSAATLAGQGELTAVVMLSGTFSSAVLAFEVSPNGTNWFAAQGVVNSTGAWTPNSGTVSAAESYTVPILGMQFRVRLVSISSGSVAVRINSNFVPIGAQLPLGNAQGAGENHIGEVSQNYTTIQPTVTVSTSQYASGDNVGGKLTISNAARVSGGAVRIESISITDASNQKAAMGLIIFDSDPSAGTYTDNAALALSTDLTKAVAYIPIASANFVTIDSKAILTDGSINKVVKPATGTTLYGALVTTETPTYAATSALTVKLGVVRA